MWSYVNWLFIYLPEINYKPDYILYLDEFKQLVYAAPSDYCVFHTRLHLLSLLNQTELTDTVLCAELELIDDLLIRYPYYETAWNYCKYFLLFVTTSRLNLNLKEDLCANLNEQLKKSIENRFFKLDVKPFLLEFNTNADFKHRLARLAEITASLYKLDKHEHAEAVEKYSRKFLSFLNKFLP